MLIEGGIVGGGGGGGVAKTEKPQQNAPKTAKP